MQLAASAVKVMEHRGPDDLVTGAVGECGSWGMCRLAIRDTSDAGRQPFVAGRVSVIFNGEIYNTDELRAVLCTRGHEFHSTCDTEVLLKCYLEFGVAAFGLLDGIFAVAIADGDRNEFLLARDEFGVKPLFVSSSPGSLRFASEPKALRELGGLSAGPDEEQLERYLRYQYVPEPATAWKNVRRIPRGSVEIYSLDHVEFKRSEDFVQPDPGIVVLTDDPQDWVAATDEALRLSVKRQMISDRPLGVFLSGGVDSTIISAYAAETHPGLKAFGISVPGWERDERRYMDEACKHLDVDLTVTTLTEGDFDRLVDRVIDTYDEPFGDFSALPTMLVSEVAAQDLRVVLSGDGGDELFGGYGRYNYAVMAERLGLLPAPAARLAARGMQMARRGPAWIVQRVADESAAGGHGYAALLALRTRGEAAALLGRSGLPALPLAPRGRGSVALGHRDPLTVAMAIDLDQYLPADIHTKVDRATMSVSLEARVPLLGAPVARLAEQMPTSIKVRDGVGKWPLKKLLLRRGFTEDFVHRPKAGFSFPMSEWLRRAVVRRPEYEELLRDPPTPLDRAACGQTLDALMSGADSGHAVWSLLVLSGWLTRNPA